MSTNHREEYDWSVDQFVPLLDEINRSHVYPHIFNNNDREVGGVLVGHKSVTGYLPIVYGAVSGLGADEQRATLTFTQDTWEHVHREIEENYPKGDIVGWYHSHPGFGIFLSEHDLFIHHNFFSDSSQIALVIDPISREEGVFAWAGDQVKERYRRSTPLGWGPPAELHELTSDDYGEPQEEPGR